MLKLVVNFWLFTKNMVWINYGSGGEIPKLTKSVVKE